MIIGFNGRMKSQNELPTELLYQSRADADTNDGNELKIIPEKILLLVVALCFRLCSRQRAKVVS